MDNKYHFDVRIHRKQCKTKENFVQAKQCHRLGMQHKRPHDTNGKGAK